MHIHDIGKKAEQFATTYLCERGLTLQTSNYRGPQGEIDLIMLDKNQLVFIEVRYRKNNHYGSAADTISTTKQRKIAKTARYYLATRGKYDKIPCRFDVIAISHLNKQLQVDWIKNAFYGDLF